MPPPTPMKKLESKMRGLRRALKLTMKLNGLTLKKALKEAGEETKMGTRLTLKLVELKAIQMDDAVEAVLREREDTDSKEGMLEKLISHPRVVKARDDVMHEKRRIKSQGWEASDQKVSRTGNNTGQVDGESSNTTTTKRKSTFWEVRDKKRLEHGKVIPCGAVRCRARFNSLEARTEHIQRRHPLEPIPGLPKEFRPIAEGEGNSTTLQDEALHPSWAAHRAEKMNQREAEYKGAKTVFDDGGAEEGPKAGRRRRGNDLNEPHPSWEAKKAPALRGSAVDFKGSRVAFSDDDGDDEKQQDE